MQSAPCGLTAKKDDRRFADPSMGRPNFPPKYAVGSVDGSIKRLPAPPSGADLIWRALPQGTARLAVFISVSKLHQRTPMNNPLRSTSPEKLTREAGFDEGCCLN
jgi:hypothetical protein